MSQPFTTWNLAVKLTQQLSAAVLCLAIGACGDDEPKESLSDEIDAFVSESNEQAREVCDAPADVAQQESGDSEAAACYFELAVEIESCERAALDKHPEQARALLDCTRAQRDELIACCIEDECSSEALDVCAEELWGEGQPPCDANTDEVMAALEACE